MFVLVRGMMEPAPHALEIATNFKSGVGALADALSKAEHFEAAVRFSFYISDNLQDALTPKITRIVMAQGMRPDIPSYAAKPVAIYAAVVRQLHSPAASTARPVHAET
ncbi:hypothetical protein [Pseudomonas farris]